MLYQILLLSQIQHLIRRKSLKGAKLALAFPRVKHYGTTLNGQLIGNGLLILRLDVIMMARFLE